MTVKGVYKGKMCQTGTYYLVEYEIWHASYIFNHHVLRLRLPTTGE